MDKLKILVVCGAGLGSSFACQMTTEDVLKHHNIEVNIDHSDISSAVSMNADIIMTASNFRSQFENYNIDEDKTVSKVEIAEKLLPVIEAKTKK